MLASRMKVALNRRRARQRWHGALLARLIAGGHCACVCPDAEMLDPADVRSSSLRGLMRLERAMGGGSDRGWLVDAPSPAEEQRYWSGPRLRLEETDLILELGNTPRFHGDGVRTLVPTFDGRAGMTALWNALLAGRAPVLGVHDSATGLTTTLAVPALEAPHRLLESAEAVLVHLVAGLVRAVDAISAGNSVPHFATTPAPEQRAAATTANNQTAACDSALPALLRRLTRQAAEKRDRLSGSAPTWQVAYRLTNARTLPGESLASAAFQRLPDDARRFYADPFVVRHDGVHHVFVEELPEATGRGVISHFVIDASGKASPPRVILEEPHHLSYPQVFQHDGTFWMLPEASTAGRLDLYRAVRFPDQWVHHATLIDAPVHDATFFAHEGRLWLFAGTMLPGASSWDTLSLYHAERLDGPWRAHALNPVLVDARSARPAGELFMHDGALWRPAQDCTLGYGGALSLCRIDTLDPERFSQTLVSTLHFGGAAEARGPHTLNACAGLEIIDLFAPRQS